VRRIDLERAQGARVNTIRDINRQLVLNYVRERGPISRAEIAREANLQRSTVSAIVEELQSEGLIEEIGIGESTGGRPPNLLRLRAGGPVALGVDITTVHTTVATCNLTGKVIDRLEFPTDPDVDVTLGRAIQLIRDLNKRAGGSIEGVGIALPGQVDFLTGTATYVPYFDWRDIDIEQRVSSATGLRVRVDNDANAAALAELWFGRPEMNRIRDFMMVLVHNGVGTGVVFDGQVYRGHNSIAGEFGHIVVGTDAPVICSCGKRHCWEAFACVRSAVARYKTLSAGKGKRPGTIDFQQLVIRALRGDDLARAAIEETGRYLGVGLANLSVGLSPEAIVVSGTILLAWPIIARIVNETVDQSLSKGFGRSPIIPSSLSERETLLGALSLTLTEKFGLIQTA
jgi:predicted NBD/HSP70 family sugar kinase